MRLVEALSSPLRLRGIDGIDAVRRALTKDKLGATNECDRSNT